MFHAGFVTFHNSQQKHNETSVEPPGGNLPHNIRQRGTLKSLSTRFECANSWWLYKLYVFICCHMLLVKTHQPANQNLIIILYFRGKKSLLTKLLLCWKINNITK